MNPYTYPGIPSKSKAEKVLDKISKHYKVSREELLNGCRKEKSTQIRREAMWLLKHEAKMSDKEIGELFGVDRSTVFKTLKKQKGFNEVYGKSVQ